MELVLGYGTLDLVKRNRTKQKGFTMIELLLVMAITGMLATAGITSYVASLRKGRDAQRKLALENVVKAVETYSLDVGVYPASCGGKIVGCDGNVCEWGTAFTNNGKDYISLLPTDPVVTQNYVYTTAANGKSFQIYAKLEAVSDPHVKPDGYGVMCDSAGGECNFGLSSTNVTLVPTLDDSTGCP